MPINESEEDSKRMITTSDGSRSQHVYHGENRNLELALNDDADSVNRGTASDDKLKTLDTQEVNEKEEEKKNSPIKLISNLSLLKFKEFP
jgi:predicted subunit of tRNA(5-methylaminomethyl-2-thiouridylate) methyltransferase